MPAETLFPAASLLRSGYLAGETAVTLAGGDTKPIAKIRLGDQVLSSRGVCDDGAPQHAKTRDEGRARLRRGDRE
jgi:hypothetical protein